MDDRMYLCIDLKSFFASVECAERGLDTMTTRLVVGRSLPAGAARSVWRSLPRSRNWACETDAEFMRFRPESTISQRFRG